MLWPRRSRGSKSNIRKFQKAIEQFETRNLMAADFVLTKDIHDGIYDELTGLGVSNLCVVGSTTYFTKSSLTTGIELWKTDGTEAGTSMVKDIVPGLGSSQPTNLINFNGTLFFRANDGASGFELWKSDGTASGTVMVKDIAPGAASALTQTISTTDRPMAVVGSQLFFIADDGTSGVELWKSDGTIAGTVQVKDLIVGSGSSNPSWLTNISNSLYYAATDSAAGRELFRSDGTAAGTVILSDPISPSSTAPTEITNVNGSVFFSGLLSSDRELFRFNGSSSSLVLNIAPGASSSGPHALTNFGGTLYFAADDGTTGKELWKSGGTSATTSLVKDISPSGSSGADELTVVGSTLFFRATDGSSGFELWKSDGTTAGTVMARDINFGTASSDPLYLTNVAGALYFRADDGTNGIELWRSTANGSTVQLLQDTAPGAQSSSIRSFVDANGVLMFAASDGASSRLWRSDATTLETYPLSPIDPGSSHPLHFASFNNQLIFSASTINEGRELWVSDGTLSGTRLLKDIYPGSADANPKEFYPFNGHLYFQATDEAHGTELWRTDGTSAGTVLVADISANSANPSRFVEFNGQLFFTANSSTNGASLWTTDGTTIGTRLVSSFNALLQNGNVITLAVVGNTLYVHVFTSTAGAELWKSDGTSAGTTLVKDTLPGNLSGVYGGLTPYKGQLFFIGNDGSTGTELFRSDGTATGTVLVKDTNLGPAGNVRSLTVFSNFLMFTANDGSNGTEMWRSDGTPAGTAMLKDIAPGVGSSNPADMFVVGNQLFFTADDGTNGRELWRTDGTAAGTVLVKDLRAGSGSSNPDAFSNVNGKLYFQADDGINGAELWVSDGTSTGTTLRKDFALGSGSSNVGPITQLNDRLFAVATTEATGTELWMLDPDMHVTQPGSSPRSVLLQRNGINLEAINQNTSTVIQSQELAFTRSITVDGATSGINNTNLTYNTVPFISLPDGIGVNGQAGATDNFQLNALNGTTATYRSSGTELGTGTLTIGNSGLSQIISLNEQESLALSGLQSLTIDGPLPVGNQSLTLTSSGLVNLSGLTQLSGGSISSNSFLALGSGELLTGFGSITGRMAAEVGSMISATGSLSIGNSSSASGFLTHGDINTGANTITLLDSNEAVLGAETVLGFGSSSGTIVANNGLLVDFGNNVIGFGTLSTLNSPTRPLINNGSILGSSVSRPITLPGFIKGVGTLSNVNITGTFSPGFSPAAVTLGAMTYATGSQTIVELGGRVAGTEYDQINHTALTTLGGILSVQLINGFKPELGQEFLIMTSSGGFNSSFDKIELPQLDTGLDWQVITANDSIRLVVVIANVAPSELTLSSTSINENSSLNSVVGQFATSDANSGDTFTLSFVSGVGSTDNALFTIDATGKLKTASGVNFESKPAYAIRVRTTDQGGLFFEKSFAISVNDLPELASGPVVGTGTAQRSMVNQISITFDGPIVFDSGAFAVTKRGPGGGDVGVSASSALNAQGQSVVTLNFTGAFTRGTQGTLLDGYYQLTIDGTKIHRGTQLLDTNQDGAGGDSYQFGTAEVDKFFSLYGDTDGDGIVGVAEFGQFRSTFGKSTADAGFNPFFDYENDGIVGVSDFGQFRSRFGKPKISFV